jgi:GTP-binding protein
MNKYFEKRHCLKGAILVMDCRHPFKPFDEMMFQWCVDNEISTHIILTKSDKLRKGAASTTKLNVMKSLNELPSVSVQLFSALKKEGLDELHAYLNKVFEF